MNKQELIKLFNRKIEHYQEMLQGEHDDLADSIKIDIKALKTKTLETIDQIQNDRNIADEIKLAEYKSEQIIKKFEKYCNEIIELLEKKPNSEILAITAIGIKSIKENAVSAMKQIQQSLLEKPN